MATENEVIPRISMNLPTFSLHTQQCNVCDGPISLDSSILMKIANDIVWKMGCPGCRIYHCYVNDNDINSEDIEIGNMLLAVNSNGTKLWRLSYDYSSTW